MRDIYSNTTKVFVGSKSGNNVVNLSLDKLLEANRRSAAETGAPAAASAASGATAPQPAAVPSPASQPAAASDVLRSRDALRSRSREDDLPQ